MPYTVYTCLPGCLPDGDTTTVDSFPEARSCVHEMLDDQFDPEVVRAAAHAVEEHGGRYDLPDGYTLHAEYRTWLEFRDLLGFITNGNYPTPSEKLMMLEYANRPG